jgi:hypothetical protein
MVVYVLNRFGKPLMPCKPQKARKLLQAGKAEVVRRTPFTIQLKYRSGSATQEVTAGMDTGSKIMGCAAVANGKVLYQSEVQLRQDDAVAICCEDGEVVESPESSYLKRHVPRGDYRQTKGKRSELYIPTRKLFGLRKFDLIQTSKGSGFVKGKRSSGFFAVETLAGEVIGSSVNVKKNCVRLQARSSTLIALL